MIALLAVFGAVAAQPAPRYGMLTACVIQAQSLENLDADNLHFFNFGDTSDPYATLRVEGQECSTVTLWDKENAEWNHCCSFGLVKEDEPVHVIITDEDERGEDDLIGLACTSVSTGLRWLDLIRHDSVAIVGSVNVAIVFELTPQDGVPSLPLGTWTSVNGTTSASCPENSVLTDCVCKPDHAPEIGRASCGGITFEGNTCIAETGGVTVGARCLNVPAGMSVTAETRDGDWHDVESTAECKEGEALTGCVSKVKSSGWGKFRSDVTYDPHSCSAVLPEDELTLNVQAQARCVAIGGGGAKSVLFTLNSWAPAAHGERGIPMPMLPPMPFLPDFMHRGEPDETVIEARCPKGFALAGCGCKSGATHDACRGAVLNAHGSCLVTVAQRHGPRASGVWAEARCLWVGSPETLLEVSASSDAATCRPLADGDAKMERERHKFVQRLSEASGRNWARDSVGWWRDPFQKDSADDIEFEEIFPNDFEFEDDEPLMGGLAGLMGSFMGAQSSSSKELKPSPISMAADIMPVFQMVKGLAKSPGEGREGESNPGLELPPLDQIGDKLSGIISLVKDQFAVSGKGKSSSKDDEQDREMADLREEIDRLRSGRDVPPRMAARAEPDGEDGDGFLAGIFFTVIVGVLAVVIRTAWQRRGGVDDGRRRMLESELNVRTGSFAPQVVSPLAAAQGTLVQPMPMQSVPVVVDVAAPPCSAPPRSF